MTKYVLSFLSGLSLTFLVLFFVKLTQNNVQRIDVSAVLCSFGLLVLAFAYYVSRRIGSAGQRNK